MKLRRIFVNLLESALGGKAIELPINQGSLSIQFNNQAIEVIANYICEVIETDETLTDDLLAGTGTELNLCLRVLEAEDLLAKKVQSMRHRTMSQLRKMLEDVDIEVITEQRSDSPSEATQEPISLQSPIERLNLFENNTLSLKNGGIKTIGDLTACSVPELLLIQGICLNDVSLDIRGELEKVGFALKEFESYDEQLLGAVLALPIEKLSLFGHDGKVAMILKRNGIHTINDLVEIPSTLELLMLDGVEKWMVSTAQDQLKKIGLALVEDNRFCKQVPMEEEYTLPIEKLFSEDETALIALRSNDILTVNALLNLAMEELFEILQNNRNLVFSILGRLKMKGFQLHKTGHALGLSLSELCQKIPISTNAQFGLRQAEIETTGELVCYSRSELLNVEELGRTRVDNLR